MREKLNSSPIAQVAVVAVLVIAAAYLLLGGAGGGEESSASSTTTTSTTAEAPPGSGEASAGGEASTGGETTTAGATSTTATSAADEAASAAIPASVPAPPLPPAVSSAYQADKTVVLLVVHDGGIEDGLVARAVERLKSDSGLTVFVVPARRIARYAAITLGVDVEQVPALIVMRPRRLSGGTPQASLSYGFQTPQSVVQAVRDASYKGPEVAYHPN